MILKKSYIIRLLLYVDDMQKTAIMIRNYRILHTSYMYQTLPLKRLHDNLISNQ